MKKTRVLLAVTLFAFSCIVSSVILANVPEVEVKVEINENDIMHCRCKHGGCYAGNWLSFRSECATGHGAVDCTASAQNCPR